MRKITSVILAGGYGTRVKHLLPNVPKPMASVADKPFLEWILRYLKSQGITQNILSTGYLSEVIEEHFQNQPVPDIEVYCCQEKQPLGTAGGFLNVVEQTNISSNSWLVMNGDSLIVAQFNKMISYLDNYEVDVVILGVSVEDTSRYGSLVVDKSGNLISFAEKRQGAGIINGGVYLFRHQVLEKFPSRFPLSFEYDVFPALLNKKQLIKVHQIKAPFLDIGTPETLPKAEAFILENFSQLLNPC
ncbi:nucleotidyltransferase family protein [cyanobacterium endosymbiont of Epithemia turgida]|uniref:nucleotidyltransferase family protein n=1 Tax=cyanobacterium endosymbiont of Epithemia turgida TaxID=718217 RepID=UPI0004D15E18|nr:nucleotidyltransferase family protein [cyanobacterium endosymbiont of Epithemia turgida]BAP16924.1 putative nucleotidyl transferase [cyanobacterium endosymbiont of Epithemia turgida isolate EtSB Lake Yunoko]